MVVLKLTLDILEFLLNSLKEIFKNKLENAHINDIH